jgi:hypothetical protein
MQSRDAIALRGRQVEHSIHVAPKVGASSNCGAPTRGTSDLFFSSVEEQNGRGRANATSPIQQSRLVRAVVRWSRGRTGQIAVVVVALQGVDLDHVDLDRSDEGLRVGWNACCGARDGEGARSGW